MNSARFAEVPSVISLGLLVRTHNNHRIFNTKVGTLVSMSSAKLEFSHENVDPT